MLRTLSRVLAGLGAAAAMAALTAGPVLADPPSIPRPSDVVGAGAGTTQFLYDQFSHDYYSAYPYASSLLYSWDALPPGQAIMPKAGCSQIGRPAGSSAGIAALESSQTIPGGTGFCVDYARSARPRSASDPACSAGGICFIRLAGDAVTWASRSAAAGGTNAPLSLTLQQLQSIYLCQTTNWNQVGGGNGIIKAFLPQSSSDTRAFFLLALGGGTTPLTPGPCVSTSGNTLTENQGVARELNDPNAIVPYSVADYIAQFERSASCANGSSCGYPGAPACSPSAQQNLFGCDVHGVLTLNEIQNTAATNPFPIPRPPCDTGHCVTINPEFPSLFQGDVFTVVRFAATADHIPAYLEPFFAAHGWICSSSAGQLDIQDYGFLALSPACGTPLAGGPAPSSTGRAAIRRARDRHR